MLRLFIAFLFLAFSPFAFSNTTFYYYEKNGGGFCSTSPAGICSSLTHLTNPSCSLSGSTVTVTWTITHNPGTPLQRTETASGNAGVQRSIVCPIGTKLELTGCTATCVKENKCESKLGQKEQRVAQCGMLTGGNCTTKPTPDAGDTFTKTCDTYKFDWLPLSGKYNLGGCEATVTKQVPLVKNNGNLEPNDVYDGSSNNIPLNCEIELTYNGQEFTDSPTSAPPSAPKSSTTGGSATKPTTDGSSGQPTDTTGGLKPSINGTSDGVGTDTGGGSGGTCTVTGQTLINGSCQCPSGQTVQNNQCTTTTNTGGGDSGGSCTITGQTQVNGTCQCPTGQTVKDNKCTSSATTGDDNSKGSYTGSRKCEQAPECEGDVVLCGLVAEQYKAKCEMLESLTELPEELSEKLEKIGTATNDPKIGVAESNANNILNELSQKIGFSNTSCPADMSIHVLAKTIIIPISETCNLLKLIRLLLHLATYFFCLRMLWSTVATV